MYALLKSDEDGNPFRLISSIENLLANPSDYGVNKFESLAWLRNNIDTNYWADGIAVLLKVEVIEPVPVTAKWALPNIY